MNYFDLHCDTAYECYVRKQPLLQNDLAISVKQGAAFEDWRQVFAVWVRDDQPAPFSFYRAVLSDFQEKIKQKPKTLTPFLAVEGGAVIGEDLDLLDILREDGVCMLTLTWNGQNALAGGTLSDGELTALGGRAIERLNRLGMGCDLSHLNDRSFYAAVEKAEYPLATHSNCRALKAHPRNLTDEQLCLIGEKNGLIGLCFYPAFLGDGDPCDLIFRHLVHLCELGLENHVAVGSDFDGAVMHESLDCLSKVPSLYEALHQKGLPEDFLRKFFFENAKNYFDKRLPVIYNKVEKRSNK